MAVKRLISLILFTLCLFSATAQDQLTFTPAEWDFGPIREAGGRVSHVFTGVNRSSKPLVILDVVATCGCTVPEFSRRPIPPGGKTQITVTFDPYNRPGTFTKELGVYSSERKKVATLTIRGHVAPRPKSIEELYPVDAGGGLRLTTTLCAFTYIYPGQQTGSAIGYINTLPRSVRLDLRARDASGLLHTDYSRAIGAGERGEINLSYSIPANEPRYGTLRDALEVVVDGQSNSTMIVAHGIGVDKPTETTKENAPRAQISENMIKFGAVKRGAPVQRLTFTLTNTGGSELIVRAVEGDGHVTTTLKPGQKVAAGASFRAEVLLDPATQQIGIMTDHLLLVTNDPSRPMRRLRVSAIIEGE